MQRDDEPRPDVPQFPRAGEPAAEGLARYLRTVAFWLPRRQRRDILAELEGDLRTQVEEQESVLGRPLSAPEMQLLLERWGHPRHVASRFLPQRALIGPEVFPLYVLALKVVALAYVVPWLLVWIGLLAFSPSYRASHPALAPLGALSTLASIVAWAFAAITLGFAALERSCVRAGLPADWSREPPGRDPLAIPRAGSACELATHVVFIVWWLNPGLRPAPALSPWIELHERLFVPVLLLSLIGATLACTNWIRPRWTRARLGAHAVLYALSASIFLWLLGPLPAAVRTIREITRLAGAPEAEALERLSRAGGAVLLLGVAVIAAVYFAVYVVRAVRWGAATAHPSA